MRGCNKEYDRRCVKQDQKVAEPDRDRFLAYVQEFDRLLHPKPDFGFTFLENNEKPFSDQATRYKKGRPKTGAASN